MLRFALIGCGRIARWHVEAVAGNSSESKLVAVCDICRSKADEKADIYAACTNGNRPYVYTDFEAMLKEQIIDVVTIATESGYHYSIALKAINEGKHVLVEKPMALSSRDAELMVEAANNKGVKLGVCHQNRFNPAIRQLRRAVEAGSFARIINGTATIRWNRNDQYYSQAPWRGTWAMDGGTLMNQCIHDIDLLQWMLGGQVESVYAQRDTFLRNIEGEDFGAIIIRFLNGSIGIVEGSACVFPKNLSESLAIFGERGTAIIGGLAVNNIEVWSFENDPIKENQCINVQPETVYGSGHVMLFKDMIDAIKHGRQPLINGVEGRKALDIVLAAYKSSLIGQAVAFPYGEFSTIDMARI